MNRKELSQNHWKYYLMLEKRFVESIEFVELHEDNFDAFSNGYALLIQAIGAELDTVFKEFCGFNVRDFLGHSDIKTTDIYARSSLTMKQKALERVSDSPVPSMPSWQKSRSTMEWLKSFGSQKA